MQSYCCCLDHTEPSTSVSMSGIGRKADVMPSTFMTASCNNTPSTFKPEANGTILGLFD